MGHLESIAEPAPGIDRPILVYDDTCGICTRAARFVRRNASVEIVGLTSLTDELREMLPDDYERCAHLITADGVYSCGEAMVGAYELTGRAPARILPAVRWLPGYERVREGTYRLVARNRARIGRWWS